jgi:hypothetical protein
VLSGFGVEKAAHGIELTEIQSENSHSTCVLRVWGWNFVTFERCKRRTRSQVRVARFYSKGSHPKPRTYMDSFWPTRPQNSIVLVLSPLWRTVLVLVIERVACMASTRLPLRLTNRRSLTRGSCSLSPFAYPLPNSCPISALTRME